MTKLTNANKISRGKRGTRSNIGRVFLLLLVCLGWSLPSAMGQTGGEAAITGVVTDTTGAAVPNASVVAKNVNTGVETKRVASAAGVYEVSPLIPGTYTLKIAASGFQSTVQEAIELHENMVLGLNPVLKVGSQQEVITVTEAPPSLDTDNAVLGATIENSEFMELPILVSGNQQRDVTSFSNLLPGAQSGSRSSLFSGTANRVQEVYLDGIPMTTISQIGDNRPILNAVPSEGIGEIGALTSGQSAEYQGAGSVNYSMKTGGNKYHGTVADFVRNTVFDTWGFTAAYATQKKLVNGVVTTVPVGKPVDHQNELSAAFGGPITIPHFFNGHDKLFFFAAYDKVHTRSAPTYASATVPTALMRQGNFTELTTPIYDPTSLANCTAHNKGVPCRYQFGFGPGNSTLPGGAVATGVANVIPSNEISPIAQKMESFLPDAIPGSGVTGNYLGGTPTGYDNWLYSGRFDYTISPKQTLSGTVTGGNRHAVPYTASANMILPLPYVPTTLSTVAGHWADLSDSYTMTTNLVNQFKFGFSNFGGPPLKNVTEGINQYEATTMGIRFTGVPSGQATNEFPTNIFSGGNGITEWGEGSVGNSATSVTDSYTGVDNLLWIKGKHAMTFGLQMQWLEMNADACDGPTCSMALTWSTSETASVTGSKYAGGDPYASFMLGAVNSTGMTLQPFSVLGGRYNTIAPYAQDDYKVTSKLTLNLGLRWDYLPTYHEVKDRFSFLNPNIVNPVTGNMGALQFAGSWGGSGVSIGKRTPVNTYWKNWGPRVGFAYAVTPKTTVRAAYSLLYSHGGGTGGAGNTYNGPSQNGFTSSVSYSGGGAGAGAGPAFYLNDSAGFSSLGIANNNFGGPGYTMPGIASPGAVSQTLGVASVVDFSGASSAPGYADPYLSGRAPEFSFWNFGVQRQMTNNIVLTVNYTGSESHFIAGASNLRGKYSGQIDPKYYTLGSLLTQPGTAANLAAAGVASPYGGFTTAAATTAGGSKATVGQALTWMPQFYNSATANATTDTWGSQSANASYHSLQISLEHKLQHNLTLNMNYTYSKNLDDAGTMRSGYAIPASASLNGKASAANRADRSISANSIPQNLVVYGVYKSPFGKGGIGANSMLVRQVAGGWSLSGIVKYYSGTPLLVIKTANSTSCNSTNEPRAGTCMPDLNPNFTGKTIRQNGSWGKGINALNLGKAPSAGGIAYASGYVPTQALGAGGVDSAGNTIPCAASTNAFCNPGAFMIGDAPRSAPFGLRNPSEYNVDMGVQRTFTITEDRLKFIFRADCSNVTNHVTFSSIGVTMDNATFGTVGAAGTQPSRDFQFSGRLNF